MNRTNRLEQLEQTLREAHHNRPVPTPDENWNRLIMHRIRQQRISPVVEPLFPANPFIWRFAVLSSSIAVALSVYSVHDAGNAPSQIALNLFMGDPLLAQAMRLLIATSGITF